MLTKRVTCKENFHKSQNATCKIRQIDRFAANIIKKLSFTAVSGVFFNFGRARFSVVGFLGVVSVVVGFVVVIGKVVGVFVNATVSI